MTRENVTTIFWHGSFVFGWSAAKAEANRTFRGIEFELAASLFDDVQGWEREDLRKEYGERRFVAYGLIDGRLFVCVYTDRRIGNRTVRWIISLRKGNRRERQEYEDTNSPRST